MLMPAWLWSLVCLSSLYGDLGGCIMAEGQGGGEWHQDEEEDMYMIDRLPEDVQTTFLAVRGTDTATLCAPA